MNIAPRSYCGDSMNALRDVRHERLAEPDVAVGMLVGREAVASPAVAERRVDEAICGKVPAAASA